MPTENDQSQKRLQEAFERFSRELPRQFNATHLLKPRQASPSAGQKLPSHRKFKTGIGARRG